MSGEWQKRQAEVWGEGDTFAKVAERIKTQEPEVLRRVERAIENGAPTHTVVWTVTNSILRGLESMPEGEEEPAPEGHRWDAFAGKWVKEGLKTGPAINPNPTGA